MITTHGSRGTFAKRCLMLLGVWGGFGAAGCDARDDRTAAPAADSPSMVSPPPTRNPPPTVGADRNPTSRTAVAPANVASGAARTPSAVPSGNVPPGEGAAGKAARGSPRAAAESLLAALRRRDALALAEVMAPGKDGTSEQRVAQALAGKGKLRSLAAALREGTQLAPGVEVQSEPEDGRQVVKIALDLTDADGATHKVAAVLEVFKFDDGWRVDDFDRTGGNWPR